VGADFRHPMLVIARGKAEQAKAEQIDFVEADAQTLPFAENQFQIVSVAFGLRNVTDADRSLREMVRVCREGGRIAVLEFSMPQWQPFKFFYRWYFHRVLPRIARAFARSGRDAYEYLPQSVDEFPSGQALAERMRAAGASQVRSYPLTLGIATLYVGIK